MTRQSIRPSMPPPLVPYLQSSMPPPPIPSSRMSLPHGPDIHVPIAWHQAWGSSHPAYSTSSMPQTGNIGYSPQHSHYQASNRYWASKAHAHHPPPPVETYLLDIWAVYESGSKRNTRLNNFGSIHEGKPNIDAHSYPQDIVQAALSKLLPLIRAYCPEFPCHDGPGYFYEECLVDSKKGAKKFKSGKQFLLYVVVPEKQWDEVEQFRENLKALPSTSSPRRARALCTVVSVSSLNTTASSGLLSTSTVRSSRKTTSAKLRVPASSNPTAPAIPTASKRSQHQRGNSLTFQFPPSKKSARAADPASDVLSESPLFTSPNRDHLKQALQSGGNTDLDVKSVEFYLIPGRKLAELINQRCETESRNKTGRRSMSNAFDIKMVERFSGHIRVDANETTMLGVGAFKTAQAIELTLFPLRSSGIGCIASHSIAGKRPYLNPTGGIGCRPYIRFSMGDESRRLYREANVLYWAMALLDFSYEYIDQCIADAEGIYSRALPLERDTQR
ncbi:hypothetical protein L210DRAFT_3647645 [Boletus edulis BED1]|uniref:Uncharacterized protein n=1 Tax=Boletus edulis BED1 TaxID=1328754 RepID=A0AAD4BPL5_BOLED|nr:hypothetical protein L210DRAFT_3647645 [Boletus edulis BED1]